jgi:hypothetical protein
MREPVGGKQKTHRLLAGLVGDAVAASFLCGEQATDECSDGLGRGFIRQETWDAAARTISLELGGLRCGSRAIQSFKNDKT